MLQWSLALELYEAGRLAGLAPVLVGELRGSGAIGRFELGPAMLSTASPSGGRGARDRRGDPNAPLPPLPESVSLETLGVLQRLANRLSLRLSADCHVRTVRGTVEALLRCTDAMQWCDLADDTFVSHTMLHPVKSSMPTGGAASDAAGHTDASDAGDADTGFLLAGEEEAPGNSAAFERVCARMLYAPPPKVAIGGARAQRLGDDFSAALLSRPMRAFTEAFAEHETISGGADSSGPPSSKAALNGAVTRLTANLSSASRRAATDPAHRGGSASGGPKRKEAGVSVEELLRRLGDPTGLDQLLSVARLAPAEHMRALEEAGRWCARRGYDQVDDLLGGGVDLDADSKLWEDFLAGLKLSSAILGNRIRRELMRRRATLVDATPPPPSSPSPTKGWRRGSAGGAAKAKAAAGKACPIQ